MTQINGCGERAANRYENLVYWTYNWRQGRRFPTDDRNLQKGKVLSTGILRMRFFTERYEQMAEG